MCIRDRYRDARCAPVHCKSKCTHVTALLWKYKLMYTLTHTKCGLSLSSSGLHQSVVYASRQTRYDSVEYAMCVTSSRPQLTHVAGCNFWFTLFCGRILTAQRLSYPSFSFPSLSLFLLILLHSTYIVDFRLPLLFCDHLKRVS